MAEGRRNGLRQVAGSVEEVHAVVAAAQRHLAEAGAQHRQARGAIVVVLDRIDAGRQRVVRETGSSRPKTAPDGRRPPTACRRGSSRTFAGRRLRRRNDARPHQFDPRLRHRLGKPDHQRPIEPAADAAEIAEDGGEG